MRLTIALAITLSIMMMLLRVQLKQLYACRMTKILCYQETQFQTLDKYNLLKNCILQYLDRLNISAQSFTVYIIIIYDMHKQPHAIAIAHN